MAPGLHLYWVVFRTRLRAKDVRDESGRSHGEGACDVRRIRGVDGLRSCQVGLFGTVERTRH